MTLTVLEPEGLYPDTDLEQRVMGPSVRVLQGSCKSSLAELPDAICQQGWRKWPEPFAMLDP